MTRGAGFSQRVLRAIRRERLIEPGERVLAAVSGGPDSVALVHVLLELHEALALGALIVAHFNHRLRGAESDRDAAFVAELCRRLGLECRLGAAEPAEANRKRHGSLEMTARERRHGFLREAAAAVRADKIALGHNADDQAEEVLLRLIRGTSPGGLSAMAPASAAGLIRPLLELRRAEILAYLSANGLPYRIDATNLEPCCDRNRLRLQVMPLLSRRFNPRIVETLCRHADLSREEEAWWETVLEPRWRRLLVLENDAQVAFRSSALAAEPAPVGRRLLKRALVRLCGSFFGFSRVHLDLLWRLARSDRTTGCLHLPRNVRGCREYDRLIVRLEAVAEPLPIIRIEGPGRYAAGEWKVEVERLSLDEAPFPSAAALTAPEAPQAEAENARFTCLLDEARVAWPLVLRPWQAGDRLQPLGMRGRKKVQDLFTDLKVAPRLRRRRPILCDAEKICWVAGCRIDERVKIDAGTRAVLRVSLRRREGPDSDRRAPDRKSEK